MIQPTLPAELKSALDAKLQGLPRSEVAARAALISKTYRDGGGSGAIRSETDALAYALARMPATYAAIAASLNALCEVRPDLAPETLLDVGAGPGTASWAAAQTFASLRSLVLIDDNGALRALALDFVKGSARLGELRYDKGEASDLIAKSDAADLVIASYMIGELGETGRNALAELLWNKTRDTLLIVEPGTPAGYARIIAIRQRLIAAGAHVTAPCPHDGSCPLSAPDWCHFAQRLPRSRAHKQVKGAELPFEDEKFSYVALTRMPTTGPYARVLAPSARPRSRQSSAPRMASPWPGFHTATKRPMRTPGAGAGATRWIILGLHPRARDLSVQRWSRSASGSIRPSPRTARRTDWRDLGSDGMMRGRSDRRIRGTCPIAVHCRRPVAGTLGGRWRAAHGTHLFSRCTKVLTTWVVSPSGYA